jgi:integrase
MDERRIALFIGCHLLRCRCRQRTPRYAPKVRSAYRSIFEPKTEVPPCGYLGPAYRRPPPYIYRIAEIQALLKGARHLEPQRGLRPHSYATLLGLLASTGLRLSEALRLQLNDVDLESGVLTVGRSKFHELRLVPLHASTVRALRRYRQQRDRHATKLKATTFLLSEHGGPLKQSTVHQTFSKLRLCLHRNVNGRAPRLHDFRHTFACRRLLLWCRHRGRIDHHIVWLSRYLGHRNIALTYWYFTGVPELFRRVAMTFERHWHNQAQTPHPK